MGIPSNVPRAVQHQLIVVELQQEEQKSSDPPRLSNQTVRLAITTLKAQLVHASPIQKRKLICDYLYPIIFRMQPKIADEITKKLMEMLDMEVLALFDDPKALTDSVNEVMAVMEDNKSV